MKKFLAAALIAGSLFVMPTANAEIKTYEGTDEYIMSEFETIDIAKQRAKQKAERAAQEQAGVYISSYTETKNLMLVKDEVVAIACGIMSVVDVKYDVTPLENANGFLIRATVKANIDTDDVNKYLDKSTQEKSAIVAQNKELQAAVAAQDEQIAKLKDQIKRLTAEGKLSGQREREKITQEVAAEDKIFLSNQKLEDCRKLYYNRDYQGVIKLCNEAIEINANNAKAYALRGAIYRELKNFNAAISDLSKAIELNPNYADAYNDRGAVYQDIKNYNLAFADYDKAVSLDPTGAAHYVNRGLMYLVMQNFNAAVADANKALELEKNFAEAYALRGGAYLELGGIEAQKILDDLNRAIELNPNLAFAYYCRGIFWQAMGDATRSQADVAKYQELAAGA
ncbi:MAG: tetratricopeptide repeat protein [Selenomonadaceae bacterium]|nr:tetratricopeptide repeat protein [Selenomonadaceae bacterium]